MITHLPERPWASQLFFYISLQNLLNCLHEEYRLGSARRVTCLAWSLVFEGGVILQRRISFPPVNALVRLPESTRPCVNSQSKRERRCQWLHWLKNKWRQNWDDQNGKTGQPLFCHLSTRYSWLGSECDPFTRNNFSLFSWGLIVGLFCVGHHIPLYFIR